MQRDLKIGLALGILMVGGGLAFFFGSAHDNGGLTPTLQNEELLDQEIVETKPRIPYLVRPEFEAEPEESSQPVTLHPPLTQTPPEFDLPDFLRGDDAEFQRSALARSVPAPEPIRNILSPNAPSKSTQTSGWKGVASQTSAASDPKPAEMTTHTIQPGDTLTGLAAQYLGSHARFREIYQYNKELLPSPDRLPVGTVIRIPSGNMKGADPIAQIVSSTGEKGKITQGTITDVIADETPKSRNFLADDPEADAFAEPSKRFSPSHNTPFTVGRTDDILDEPADSDDPLIRENKNTTSTQTKTYIVRKGDTLRAISIRIYGNPSRDKDIFEANRGKITSPDTIREGMILVLPE